jgi:multiple antibiotic resistance protein
MNLRKIPATIHGSAILPALLLFISACNVAYAQSEPPTFLESKLSGWRIFVMLFLMLGPTKILVPYVQMTQGMDSVFQRRLAFRAIVFSSGALLLAGLLGKKMLDNLNISLPVLTLTAGLVLFLVALRTVLQQASPPPKPSGTDEPSLQLAFSPLAFPTIVTPYGIAAVIVFATLAQNDYAASLTLAGLVVLILAMDWAAMIYANSILKWFGTALQIFSVILGVTQIALGLQLILRSLSALGIFVDHAS